MQSILCSLLLTLLTLTVIQVQADCNTCAKDTNQACISSTQFQGCKNHEPYGNIFTCNTGEYCTIRGTCEAVDVNLADCNDCQVCGSSKTHACLTQSTFALCLGTDILSPIQGSCGGDLVCNLENPNICGAPSENPATCPYVPETTTTTAATTTTPNPGTDPNGYCGLIQQEGRFPVGNDPVTTCKQYLRCIFYDGTWIGSVYYCPGGTYFDSTTKQCTVTAPPLCSTRIASLSIYNIQL